MSVDRPGQFTSEGTILTGRPALVRIRVREAGEVIELHREQLLRLLRTDGEIGGSCSAPSSSGAPP